MDRCCSVILAVFRRPDATDMAGTIQTMNPITRFFPVLYDCWLCLHDPKEVLPGFCLQKLFFGVRSSTWFLRKWWSRRTSAFAGISFGILGLLWCWRFMIPGATLGACSNHNFGVPLN